MAKKSQIEKLLALAPAAGIDGEKLVEELVQLITNRLPPPPKEIEWEAVIEKLSVKVETKIASKLADTLDAIKQAGGDSAQQQGEVIKGVAELLRPEVVSAANKAAEIAFQANAKGLTDAFSKQIDAKLAAVQPGGDNTGSNPANMSLGGLFGQVITNLPTFIDAYAKIQAARRPPELAGFEQLRNAFRLADSIRKLEKGESTIEQLGKDIAETQPKPK